MLAGRLELGGLVFVGAKHRYEGFLRDVDAAELFHFGFTFFLFLEQFVLTSHIAAVKLGGNVFPERLDGRSCDDFSADCTLNGDLKLMPRDGFGQLFAVV